MLQRDQLKSGSDINELTPGKWAAGKRYQAEGGGGGWEGKEEAVKL